MTEEGDRARAQPKASRGETRPAETARTGEARTILIVDDETRLRKALARSLHQEDCRMLTAASGEEALALLKKKTVDLVITDLVMPGMDGMTFVRGVRDAAPDAGIIIITAYGSPESIREAEELGVAGYLAKPFDLSQLKSKVSELLRAATLPEPRSARTFWFAGGRAWGIAVGLSRKIIRHVRPEKIAFALGRAVTRAASGLRSAFKRKDAKRQ